MAPALPGRGFTLSPLRCTHGGDYARATEEAAEAARVEAVEEEAVREEAAAVKEEEAAACQP